MTPPQKIVASFSPCPNDTYLFYAWVHQKIASPLIIEPHYAEIRQLNEWVCSSSYDLCKISLVQFPKVSHDYLLLPIGMAFGYGFGPKIVAKEKFPLQDLQSKKIAIAGTGTTAHFLLEHLLQPCGGLIPIRFDQITAAILNGTVDCGVIIHENRFTFTQEGLFEVADLGILWQERYRLPLPLGGLVVKRALGSATHRAIVTALQNSLDYVIKNTAEAMSYILEKGDVKKWTVAKQHIDLYVGEDTKEPKPAALAAVQILLNEMGLYQKMEEWMFQEEN